jgi:hypothetical protein
MSQDNQTQRQRARTSEGQYKGNPSESPVNEAWEATPLPLKDKAVTQKITPKGSKPKIGATETVTKPDFLSVNIVTY